VRECIGSSLFIEKKLLFQVLNIPQKANLMKLNAIFLNCTLKNSPETSNTEALINKAVSLFKEHDIESKVIRIADY
jgi:hypothetical protein